MRTITIYASDPLYAKLVTVAAKCSGQDKPSQEQIDNTLALLAHAALISAHAQVTRPEPVTMPLPVASDNMADALASPIINRAVPIPAPVSKSQSLIVSLVLLGLLFLTPGCMVARYSRTPASACPCSVGRGSCRALASTNQTESVRFSVWSCLMNEKAVKISVDKFTGKTHSGITIGSIEGTVDDDALKAIVSAAVEATIKTLLHL
jgi:hypothetical protein